MTAPSQTTVAAIGEALFDCFPDKVVLGGAPVNFAVHLQQLLEHHGGQVCVVSAVGRDELGAQLLAEVGARGVRTDAIHSIPAKETGQVRVTLSASGEPSYYIAEDAAWDFIEYSESLGQLAQNSRAIYFGTLAQRSAQSRATIQRLVKTAAHAVKVLDLNLRPPHIDSKIIETSASLADVVKLNEEELRGLRGILPEQLRDAESVDELALRLLRAYDLRLVALTRGPRGTVLFTSDAKIEGKESPMRVAHGPEADSVGAGDACCAGLVYGLLMDWPLARTLDLANHMGAYVASQPGGTPKLPAELLASAH